MQEITKTMSENFLTQQLTLNNEQTMGDKQLLQQEQKTICNEFNPTRAKFSLVVTSFDCYREVSMEFIEELIQEFHLEREKKVMCLGLGLK